MRNRVRAQGIEPLRGTNDGESEARHGSAGYPDPPGVFVSADPKGVAGGVSVSADSKGLICTKIVQNARFRGSAESKGVRLLCGDGFVLDNTRNHTADRSLVTLFAVWICGPLYGSVLS